MSNLPADKQEFLSTLSREWGALVAVIARLDETQMSTLDAGGWSPKDNLAHLTEWMKLLLGHHMDGRPAHEVLGLPEDVVKGWDFGVINAALLERNHKRTTEDVVTEMKHVYAGLLERVTSMTFDALLQPRWPERADSAPLLAYILGDTSEHFAEHRETIEKNFPK